MIVRASDKLLAITKQLSSASGGTDFWRKEDPELSGHDVLRGGMFEPQRQWWELENFVRLFVAGYGTGKTLIFCKRMVALSLINAPAVVAMISPTYGMARDTIIATTASLLEGKRSLLGTRFRWDYNQSTHTFYIYWRGRKAQLKVYSGDNPLRLRGPNLAAAGIDEPFIQSAEVFKQVVARVRHPRAVKMEINLTGTPEQLNWGYDLAMGDEGFGKYDVGMVQASTATNRALDPMYLQRLIGSMSEKEAEAYVSGQFRNLTAGQVFHAYHEGNKKTMRVPHGIRWVAGMDFNVNPMTAVVGWTDGRHLHIVDEIELANSDTQEMCSKLRDDYPHLHTIYPDPSGKQRRSNSPGGKTDFYYISQAGFDISAPSGAQPLRDTRNAVNGALRPKSGDVKITISPACQKLHKYLNLYSYPDMNSTAQKRMSHLLDAFRYLASRLFPVQRVVVRVQRLHGA